MTAFAHFVAVSCYLGATAAAATPFARPVEPPVRLVVLVLGMGVLVHLAGLVAAARELGVLPLTGLGAALSVGGLVLGIVLLAAELLAREVSLTLVAAPMAAFATTVGHLVGLAPVLDATGRQGMWLSAHILLSFVGIAAYATAAAAGAMYLVEHRELKSRRFGAVFRFFPPLDTLDRLNHGAALLGWLVLTVGVVLAVTYSFTYRALDVAQSLWGVGAWASLTTVVFGRMLGGMRARRAALVSTCSFGVVIAAYIAVRLSLPNAGRFL